ncbi:hypothetical protein AAJ76_4400013900 [Vairimorpha ceranae]|uniref:Uncharacterized protein n=1 Tax=Vairimorpha ceranae TaxID=40302 RepID=A0A0F9WDA6_9MICR|nr:hypothetical protein AAJ76_4400013900 [Vairimorpha ceranae]KKO74805.1 hypothetical protein AAJ76_4400013900 [Vairimorpha ceranae]
MSKNSSTYCIPFNHSNIYTNKTYYNKNTLYPGIYEPSRGIIKCFLAIGTISGKHVTYIHK